MNRRADLPADSLTFPRQRNMAPCAMHKLKGAGCPMYCPFSEVLPGRSANVANQCKRILEIFNEEKLINCLGYIQDLPGASVQLIHPSAAGDAFLLNVIDFVEDVFHVRITAKQRMDGAVRLLEAAQQNPAVAATNIAAAIALLKRDTNELLPPPELENAVENEDE